MANGRRGGFVGDTVAKAKVADLRIFRRRLGHSGVACHGLPPRVASHLLAYSVIVKKWVAPILALIVPNGCSTVSPRSLGMSLTSRGSHRDKVYAKSRFEANRIVRIMELITDNFSRRLHHPETISSIRHTSALAIAQPCDRSGNQGPAASTGPSSYALGACGRRASTVACVQIPDGACRVYLFELASLVM